MILSSRVSLMLLLMKEQNQKPQRVKLKHSKISLDFDDYIELKSFTDDAIDEKTESKATESKIKTEVEDNYLLTNCNCSY